MGGKSGSKSKTTQEVKLSPEEIRIAEKYEALSEEMMGYYREYGLPVDALQAAMMHKTSPYDTAAHIARTQADMELLPYHGALTREQIEAQRELLPEQTGLALEHIGAQRELLPYHGALTREQIEAQRELLPEQTGLALEHIGAQRELLPEYTATTGEFLREAREGVDRGAWADRAAADVAQGFSAARGAMTRESGRLGISPGSERFMRGMADLGRQEALSSAAAQTHARHQADDEDFRRLSDAAGLGF